MAFVGMSALTLVACNKDDDDTSSTPDPQLPYENLVKIGETYAEGAATRVVVYGNENLFVGHNTISIVLYDSASGDQITDAHVELMPVMHMNSGMNHACPVTQPAVFDDDKSIKGNVMFVMPSNDMMGSWDLSVKVHNHSNMQEGTATLAGIDVVEKDDPRVVSQTSMVDSSSYFVSLVEQSWDAGMNTYEVQISKRENMMSWPAVEDLIVEIEPEMPDMGHGSPNNVNPVHVQDGYYKGQVNFTMTGYWKVNMVLKNTNGDILAEDLAFDIRF